MSKNQRFLMLPTHTVILIEMSWSNAIKFGKRIIMPFFQKLCDTPAGNISHYSEIFRKSCNFSWGVIAKKLVVLTQPITPCGVEGG